MYIYIYCKRALTKTTQETYQTESFALGGKEGLQIKQESTLRLTAEELNNGAEGRKKRTMGIIWNGKKQKECSH